ncbi:glucose-6-phosphate isomerase family protein [Archaeoglobus profundus]|uniref:glucose-6-phosphate isomerase n=1 Tax=Archaeoglobus profundus (strain DSM 5631 / JCM 9629 / NBRC 100127 / Av18) TaxID=572546 RepID=D2RDU3_ARCPA|nr:glucose-6-phosphate isomerase family protein [Archaeoglobus profundus]ADB58287.1 glucose-6-phosphate isomerase [Archaeoglobus profundus DSM 5631]
MEIEICGRTFKADIRWAYDLKPVLAYPEELKENFPAYHMFRDVYYSKKDHEIIKEHGLRFDITVIPPNKIGKEFIKTFGHYHPLAEDNLSYTEIYEVLKGEAIYLLQKVEGDKVVDVVAIEAGEGDKVIIPPNYGHVTINPSNKELRMANWVYRHFKSNYEPYERLRGACYYYTEDGWIRNPNYGEVPDIRFVKPKIPKELGLRKSEEMYKLVRDLSKLEFLYRPSKYLDLFEEILKG